MFSDARSVALLCCLRAEADADKVRRVVKQVMAVGDFVLNFWGEKQKH